MLQLALDSEILALRKKKYETLFSFENMKSIFNVHINI